LNDIHTTQIALIEDLAIAAQSVCSRLEIQCNFCGIGDTESRRGEANGSFKSILSATSFPCWATLTASIEFDGNGSAWARGESAMQANTAALA
jgi:hypothetical protein